MPRSLITTQRGRKFLSGRRFDVRRKLPSKNIAVVDRIAIVNGHALNIPESKIYFALTDMNIRFTAQEVRGGARKLGSADADFYLPAYNTILEFQGVFHNTDSGRARDIIREANRRRLFGVNRILYLYDRDMVRIHARLRELLGRPAIGSVMTRSI